MSDAEGRDQQIMLLDIGNTNLKWAWLQDGAPGQVTSISHKEQTLERLTASQWASIQPPTQTYISNVAGTDIEQQLRNWITQHWSHEPRFIRATANACGVINAYREPARLGVDRWLTLIALRARFSSPVCVLDCGTAVTIDVLGLSGQHLGGLILPGFGLMQHALLEHTSIVERSRYCFRRAIPIVDHVDHAQMSAALPGRHDLSLSNWIHAPEDRHWLTLWIDESPGS